MKFINAILMALCFAAQCNAQVVSTSPTYPNPITGMTTKGLWHYYGNIGFSGLRPTYVGDTQYTPDILIGKYKATDNVVFTWNGCIPPSPVSSVIAGLAIPNPDFTGDVYNSAPASYWQIMFSTRWDYPDNLYIFRGANSPEWYAIPIAQLPQKTADGFCATYKLIKRAGKVFAYIDNVKIYEGTAYNANAELTVYVQTYDRAATFNSLNFYVNLDY